MAGEVELVESFTLYSLLTSCLHFINNQLVNFTSHFGINRRQPAKHYTMENLFNKFVDGAKEAAAEAGEKLGAMKDAASEKFAEVSAQAEEMAAKAKAELEEEAAEKAAMIAETKEKIAAHEGGALGFLTDKAKELAGEAKEEFNEAVEEGKSFWDKAKDYVSGDDDKK